MNAAVWAAVLSLLTLIVVGYDIVWRPIPRLRLRLWRSRQTGDLKMMFVNRGGSTLSVLEVGWIQRTGDGDWSPRRNWAPNDQSVPFTVPPHGAVLRTFTLAVDDHEPVEYQLVIEATSRGERWFAVPDAGWSPAEIDWKERTLRRLRGERPPWPRSTRELLGFNHGPNPLPPDRRAWLRRLRRRLRGWLHLE